MAGIAERIKARRWVASFGVTPMGRCMVLLREGWEFTTSGTTAGVYRTQTEAYKFTHRKNVRKKQ